MLRFSPMLAITYLAPFLLTHLHDRPVTLKRYPDGVRAQAFWEKDVNARRGMALRSEAMKLCCWLKPKLVAQVGIREWTEDGHMRHSTFLGIRDDKYARGVVRERPATKKTSPLKRLGTRSPARTPAHQFELAWVTRRESGICRNLLSRAGGLTCAGYGRELRP